MYICRDCGEIFSEPETYTENHPYGMGYASETFGCCPCCGGDYEEAVKCADCEEYFLQDDLNNGMCEYCVNNAREEIAKAVVNLFPKNIINNLPEDIFDDVWEDIQKVYKNKVGK